MFWNKKEVEVKLEPANLPPKKPQSELSIYFNTGNKSTLYYSIPLENTDHYITPWIPFYKWFFGRKGEYFILKHRKGEVLIKRDQIEFFSIDII